MDKRLLNFMMVSMLLIIGYMEINILLNPPKQPVVEPDALAVEEGAQVDPNAVVPERAADANPGNEAAQPAGGVAAVADAESEPDELTGEVEAVVKAEQKWFTLGSVDPASGYRMLVTFNSAGGTVERIELSDERYRDLVDKSAYIGHLALTPSVDNQGVRINVVGEGTPAHKGGLRVGDVITQVGGETVNTLDAVTLVLEQLNYGDDVPIRIQRDGQQQSVTLTSVRRPLEVVRPEMESDEPGAAQQQLSYLLSIRQINHKAADFNQVELPGIPSLRSENWQSELTQQNGVDTLEFRFPLSAAKLKSIGLDGCALEVVKRFSLLPTSEDTEKDDHRDYHFDFDVEVVNKGSTNAEVGLRIDGPTGLPLEGWWYSYKTHPTNWSGAGVRDVVWRAEGEGHNFYTNPMVTKRISKSLEPEEYVVFKGTPKKLQYIGVDAQYFNCTMLAAPGNDGLSTMLDHVEARALTGINEERASKTPITFRADTTILPVAVGQSTKHSFEIFAGPKHPKVLDDYSLDECIVYGWFWPFAKFMGFLLHGLHAVVRNYGIAIILLTVLVRACMLPIGRQQALNAKRMQELTPEIKKIKEKYPNETEKQAKAQQELFRKHNYNPVAGCLPMFLQLPVFIGLYRALSVDIELRQTPLIPGLDWCSNLAGPDMLWRWDSVLSFQTLTGYTGWLGPYLNLLPLISAGLFMIHQKLFTPPPTDEQQEMQQKVMKFMMLFMAVIFFKVPAGLCLYFITSSLWALGERLMLPKDDGKKTDAGHVNLGSATAAAAASATQPTLRDKIAAKLGSPVEEKDSVSAAVAAKKKRRKRNKN